MRSIKIIKNRSDIGAGTRGSDLGIDAIEIAAINKGDDYFNRFPHIDMETENDAIYVKHNTVYAKRIAKVLKVCERLSNAVKISLLENNFPIVLSGDHSSALGTVSGVKLAYPDKRIGVVWVDAHADIHSPYTSPSGNIHGMPLAAALNEDNLEKRTNDIIEETNVNWEALKNLGGIAPKVLHRDVVYFGVRDTEEQEDFLMEKYGIKNFRVEEVRFRGVDVCVNEALDKLKDCDYIYISFDVDSMDCFMISNGTGTPVPKGFDQYEVMEIINKVIESRKVAAFEVVEVNPTLDDKGNRMAEVAFDVLRSVTDKLESI